MGALAGMIITFLGASIHNIVSGIPFLPMHTVGELHHAVWVLASVAPRIGQPHAKARAIGCAA